MIKRLLSATPTELQKMTAKELLQAIRISEGRVLIAAGRVRAGNMVDGVSNAEVAAAFGADIINLDTYDITNPYIPGWDSKDPKDDEFTYSHVQVKLGKGYTYKEIEDIVGRPIGLLMLISDESDRAELEACYGNTVATPERIAKAVEQGVKFIDISGWCSRDTILNLVKEARKIVGDNVILQFDRPHGPGLMNDDKVITDLITKEEIIELLEAGIDIIGMPAPGTYPGWTIEKCKDYVDCVHEHGGMATLGLHTSQEGSMVQTIEQIALWSKMAGADLHALGDSGNNEQMVDPLNILHMSIAVKGRRHTYRRMAMSIKR